MKQVSKETFKRLPQYLRFVKEKKAGGMEYISSSVIAEYFGFTAIQVRKDLAYVSTKSGRPRSGFEIVSLIEDIEDVLGYNNAVDAVIVGAGNLGKAILFYQKFKEYGLNVLCAFDNNSRTIDTIKERGYNNIYNISEMERMILRMGVNIAILTVPSENAQMVCDRLVKAGIVGIWNFSNIHLEVPNNVTVKNEDIGASLAMLSHMVSEKLRK